jgi:hypothetical protein
MRGCLCLLPILVLVDIPIKEEVYGLLCVCFVVMYVDVHT